MLWHKPNNSNKMVERLFLHLYETKLDNLLIQSLKKKKSISSHSSLIGSSTKRENSNSLRYEKDSIDLN